MATMFGNAIGGGMDRLVRWVILPVTGVIPFLVRTGLLFAGFAALWLGFLGALVLDPSILDTVRGTLESLPLPVQAVAWLLFLPLTAGLWIWGTDWALIFRVGLIVGIAGWNLLVFFPRREPASTASPAASN
ncbi:MAG TPA: hypothetical protein VES19_01050 [Candidatus Limnocylindrales bacterium]|nr:hypothetical protein [Candidatus Limnocylindrales bacterium]